MNNDPTAAEVAAAWPFPIDVTGQRELLARDLHAGDDKVLMAAQRMSASGGSFARRIAQAYICADRSNGQRVLDAFPELFKQYL